MLIYIRWVSKACWFDHGPSVLFCIFLLHCRFSGRSIRWHWLLLYEIPKWWLLQFVFVPDRMHHGTFPTKGSDKRIEGSLRKCLHRNVCSTGAMTSRPLRAMCLTVEWTVFLWPEYTEAFTSRPELVAVGACITDISLRYSNQLSYAIHTAIGVRVYLQTVLFVLSAMVTMCYTTYIR